MKRAAAEALAGAGSQDVPDAVVKAYGDDPPQFGADYVIPKPLDPRVLRGRPSVAKAAMDSGSARTEIDSNSTENGWRRASESPEMMRVVLNKAKSDPKRIALAEGTDEKMIRAAYQLSEQDRRTGPADADDIARTADRLGLSFQPEIVDPEDRDVSAYGDQALPTSQTEGYHQPGGERVVRRDTNYLGSVMVKSGDVDAMLTDSPTTTRRRPTAITGRWLRADTDTVAGVYMLTFKNRVIFCADTTVNQIPTRETLAEVTRHTAELARRFNVEPRAAMLSYSNFGSVDNGGLETARTAPRSFHNDVRMSTPVDDGDAGRHAVVDDILNDTYEFSEPTRPRTRTCSRISKLGNIASCSSGSVAQRPLVRCRNGRARPRFSEAMRLKISSICQRRR